MKKGFRILLCVFCLLLASGTLSFAVVPEGVVKDWLLDMSGPTPDGVGVDGVAVITINEDGTFEGYGGALLKDKTGGNLITLTGMIESIDQKGAIRGYATVTDSETKEILLGPDFALTGKVDIKKFKKMTLQFENGPKAKGIPLPVDPVYPLSWSVTGKGPGGSITLSVTMWQDSGYPNRVYGFAGDGTVVNRKYNTMEDVSVEGLFFVNSKGKVVGRYTVNGADEGSLWGKASTRSFSFGLLGSEADKKTTIKGKPAQ